MKEQNKKSQQRIYSNKGGSALLRMLRSILPYCIYTKMLPLSLEKDSATSKTKTSWWTKLTRKKELTEIEIIDRERDWYYQHSWFDRKYFKDKLKRKLMNIVYEFYSSLEDYLLCNYYVGFEFYTPPSKDLEEYNKKHKTNHLGDFKCYLPMIFKVKDLNELDYLVGIITSTLTKHYGCTFFNIRRNDVKISDKIVEQEKLSNENKFKGFEIGSLNITTMTINPFGNDGKVLDKRLTKNDFRVVKSGPNMLENGLDFNIMFSKVTTEI